MPYPGLPNDPATIAKMERCVTRVMSSGKSKSSAIAICHSSIMKEATMAKKDKLSRARRLEQKVNRDKKAEMLRQYVEELEAAEPEVEELTEAAVQDVEKHYDGPMTDLGAMPYGGATTFAAMDSYRAAREQAETVNDLTYQMRCLVDNIMVDNTITDKASSIASLAGEFQARVNNPSTMKDTPTEGEPLPNPDDDDSELNDEDEPEYASIEGQLKESIGERIRSFAASLFKAPMTSGGMNDLPDSAFAYIEPGGSQDAGGRTVPRSLRHYPIHDKPHVRNALARAAAQMNGSGKGADIAKHAMAKIRAAAKRMGVGEPAASANKSSSFLITKQVDGSFRWVGWVTNKWVDKDHEILTDQAHKEFVEWLDAHPDQAPHWYTWHTPVRDSKANLWDYADGYVIMSGPATEQEAEAYKSDEFLGMSHGFFVHERDSANPLLITKYRTVEVSDLPVEAAANPWTAFEVARKELTMKFSDKKRAYLVSKLGEAKVGELESKTGDMVKTLEALGIESKESDEVKTPEPTPEEKTDPVPAQDELVKAVMDALKVTELNAGLVELKAQADKVPELEKQLKALGEQLVAIKKTDDEKVAEAIAPKTKPVEWFRASQDKSTVLDPAKSEDDKLKKAAPKYEWLENALGDVVPS